MTTGGETDGRVDAGGFAPPRILIVDDEDWARSIIRRHLQTRHPTFLREEAADGEEALAKIAAFVPDVVFLDIEMPSMTGFDVLHQLERRPFALVFQTAYDEFAIRAFEVSATDYILKPFTPERLEQALQRALTTRAAPGSAAGSRDTPSATTLDGELARQQIYLQRLVLELGARRKLLDAREVLYFSSEERHTYLHLADVRYAYDYSLSFLEERLDPAKFLRIHRNALVNLEAITAVSQEAQMTVTLRNDARLVVARDRRRFLRQAMRP